MPSAPGEHVPVGGADRRLAELADQAEQPREALGAEVLVDERHVGRRSRRGWRREEKTRSWVEAEHDAADVVVGARAAKAAMSSSSSSFESALRVSGVQRDRRDPVRDVVEKRLVGHGGIQPDREASVVLLAHPPPMPVVPADRAVTAARAYAAQRRGRVAFAVVDSHGRMPARLVAHLRPRRASSRPCCWWPSSSGSARDRSATTRSACSSP